MPRIKISCHNAKGDYPKGCCHCPRCNATFQTKCYANPGDKTELNCPFCLAEDNVK